MRGCVRVILVLCFIPFRHGKDTKVGIHIAEVDRCCLEGLQLEHFAILLEGVDGLLVGFVDDVLGIFKQHTVQLFDHIGHVARIDARHRIAVGIALRNGLLPCELEREGIAVRLSICKLILCRIHGAVAIQIDRRLRGKRHEFVRRPLAFLDHGVQILLRKCDLQEILIEVHTDVVEEVVRVVHTDHDVVVTTHGIRVVYVLVPPRLIHAQHTDGVHIDEIPLCRTVAEVLIMPVRHLADVVSGSDRGVERCAVAVNTSDRRNDLHVEPLLHGQIARVYGVVHYVPGQILDVQTVYMHTFAAFPRIGAEITAAKLHIGQIVGDLRFRLCYRFCLRRGIRRRLVACLDFLGL